MRYAAAATLLFLYCSAAAIADTGPARDVAAVRAAETAHWGSHPYGGPVRLTKARVVGDWAVLDWENGESGGMSAYHRQANGSWKRFTSGGGAFDAHDLESLGVPAGIARQLVPGSPG
jgi:hypothetical protein